MYVPAVILDEPENHVTLCKYLNYWQFEDILSAQTLYFRRFDRFANVNGTQPSNAPQTQGAGLSPAWLFLDCWSAADISYEPLWERYTDKNGGDGLAIVSSVGRIKQAISDPRDYYIGKVRYSGSVSKQSDPILIASTRDQRYRDENEVRLLHKPTVYKGPQSTGVSVRLETDFLALIQAVRVSPHASPQIIKRIRGALRQAGLDKVPVEQTRVYRLA